MSRMDFGQLMGMLGGDRKQVVNLKSSVTHTENLFGSVEDLQKGILVLHEQNQSGDCLCLFNNQYLVDVDHRDIESIR